MIARILALILIGSYDPCRDPDEIADQYARDGLHDAEIAQRTRIVNRPDADIVVDWYNLAAALRDADYPVESWFREIAARTVQWDEALTYTLDVLADEASDPAEACAIRAQVDYLREKADAYAAEEGHAEDSSEWKAAPATERDSPAGGQGPPR